MPPSFGILRGREIAESDLIARPRSPCLCGTGQGKMINEGVRPDRNSAPRTDVCGVMDATHDYRERAIHLLQQAHDFAKESGMAVVERDSERLLASLG